MDYIIDTFVDTSLERVRRFDGMGDLTRKEYRAEIVRGINIGYYRIFVDSDGKSYEMRVYVNGEYRRIG